MFTGIIEAIGTVTHRETDAQDRTLFMVTHPWGPTLALGESIALSGMCTTVVAMTPETFTVEVMGQSRRLTTFDVVSVGDVLNLERSAKVGDRNSGHYVLGHIDGVNEIEQVTRDGDFWRIRVALPLAHAHLVVDKGSVTLDGIALTVAELGGNWFEVAIIDHTWRETTLHTKAAGGVFQVEYDVMAKYANRRRALDALYPEEV